MTNKFTLVAVHENAEGNAEITYRDFGSWVTLAEAKESFAESVGGKVQNVFELEKFHLVTEVSL